MKSQRKITPRCLHCRAHVRTWTHFFYTDFSDPAFGSPKMENVSSLHEAYCRCWISSWWGRVMYWKLCYFKLFQNWFECDMCFLSYFLLIQLPKYWYTWFQCIYFKTDTKKSKVFYQSGKTLWPPVAAETKSPNFMQFRHVKQENNN